MIKAIGKFSRIDRKSTSVSYKYIINAAMPLNE